MTSRKQHGSLRKLTSRLKKRNTYRSLKRLLNNAITQHHRQCSLRKHAKPRLKLFDWFSTINALVYISKTHNNLADAFQQQYNPILVNPLDRYVQLPGQTTNLPKYTISFRSDLQQAQIIPSHGNYLQAWPMIDFMKSNRVIPSEIMTSVTNEHSPMFHEKKNTFFCWNSRKSLFLSVLIGLFFTASVVGITAGVLSASKKPIISTTFITTATLTIITNTTLTSTTTITTNTTVNLTTITTDTTDTTAKLTTTTTTTTNTIAVSTSITITDTSATSTIIPDKTSPTTITNTTATSIAATITNTTATSIAAIITTIVNATSTLTTLISTTSISTITANETTTTVIDNTSTTVTVTNVTVISTTTTIATGTTSTLASSSAETIVTTTATISTTTVTEVPTTCNCLCANESWKFDSGYLVRWTFDNRLIDLTNQYNLTSFNNPSFASNGYVNQAIVFNGTLNQFAYAPYIPLANTSFTVEMWLKPTAFLNPTDISILGLCPTAALYKCLHLVIRNISSNLYLYFGFYSNDCQGSTPLSLNQWMHAAFVFDLVTLTQSIYLNGKLDKSCTTSLPILAYNGNVTIGVIPQLIPNVGRNYYYGYLDHLTITKRAKSSCEVLEDATLAACFLFNDEAPYVDSGPNSLQTSESSTTIVSSGYSQQAISFNGTSYFQTSSFTGLGTNNKSYSIILWIRPRTTLSNIVHVSSNSSGQGWCYNFLSTGENGSLIAHTVSDSLITVWGPSIPMYPVWSHVAETWSASNGLRVYLNGLLGSAQTSANSYSASGRSDFITLGNGLKDTSNCPGTSLASQVLSPYDGDLDDFRVYSRELSVAEINTIYQN